MPLTIIWRQGSIIEERDTSIWQLNEIIQLREDKIERLRGIIKAQASTIDSQASIIDSYGQKGRMIEVPVGIFICTAYEASEVSCERWADGITSEGVPVGLGIAAADHRLLPPTTILYVHDLKAYFIVMDKGGAIKGKRLDLYTIDVPHARKFGVIKSKVSIIRRG